MLKGMPYILLAVRLKTFINIENARLLKICDVVNNSLRDVSGCSFSFRV